MGKNWPRIQISVAKAFFVNHPRNPLTSLRTFLEQDCPTEMPNKYFDESFENEESHENANNFEMEEDSENEKDPENSEEFFEYDSNEENYENLEAYENGKTFEESEMQNIEIKQEFIENGDIFQENEHNDVQNFSQSQTVALGKDYSTTMTIVLMEP